MLMSPIQFIREQFLFIERRALNQNQFEILMVFQQIACAIVKFANKLPTHKVSNLNANVNYSKNISRKFGSNVKWSWFPEQRAILNG